LRRGRRLCETQNGHSSDELIKKLEAAKQSIYGNPRLAPLLDCLNQMGNVTFLRKLRGASQSSKDASTIKDIYSEYFTSVDLALSKVGEALSKIASDFHSHGKPQ